MKAADVMISPVVTVTPGQTVREVAEILLTKRISGVPVVDDQGKIVGIVSEGDLMRRADAGTEHHRSWWLRMLMGREGLAAEYIKEHSPRVVDVMTRHVIIAGPEMPVWEIAEMLEHNGIKRVPIVDDGKLVGIISRANLLQALAGFGREPIPERPATDAKLRERVLERMRVEPWAQTSLISVTVNHGNVDLWGIVGSVAEKKAMRIAAEITPGVCSVSDRLLVRPINNVA